MSYNTSWIDRPLNSQRDPSPEETALKETFLAAQKIAYQLVCASNQLSRADNPDVTACAALIREAVHKPENQRVNAVKAAELAVLHRQADYISTLAYYQQHADAWQAIRPTLVAHLEAALLPKSEPLPGAPLPAGSQPAPFRVNPPGAGYVDVDLSLNCESVVTLIDECDIAINEANRRRFSKPTQKHAEAGFQKVFDSLVAEVTGSSWIFNARMAGHANHSSDILRDVAVDNISSTGVPEEFAHCRALDVARSAFEESSSWDNNQKCRQFNEETRGSFNDTQFAESLLAAGGDVNRILQVEGHRDTKLRSWGRSWRAARRLVEHNQSCFVRVAELLPAALAEAAAIEDEKVRRRAQNLCMFAARRLKENIKFVRECDRAVGDRDHNHGDVSAAVGRSHQALLARLASKELRRPSNKLREEPYCG